MCVTLYEKVIFICMEVVVCEHIVLFMGVFLHFPPLAVQRLVYAPQQINWTLSSALCH